MQTSAINRDHTMKFISFEIILPKSGLSRIMWRSLAFFLPKSGLTGILLGIYWFMLPKSGPTWILGESLAFFLPKSSLTKRLEESLAILLPRSGLTWILWESPTFFTQTWSSKKIILFCDIYFTHKWPHIQIGDHLWAKYDVTHMCEGAIETLVRVIRSETTRV